MDLVHRFPPGFVWGAATAAYQIEGGARADGRGPSIWDTFCARPGVIHGGHTGEVACDHYGRWREDIDMMAELGLGGYRFSISWPRVLPEGRGLPNAKGLAFYDRLTDELCRRGIRPFVTLYHWDLPQALADAGGWTNRRSIDWFADFADLMARTLGDRAAAFITINEPNVIAACGYRLGIHAPGVRDPATANQVAHHLAVAHGRATRALRAAAPRVPIGFAPNVPHVMPSSDTPADRERAAYVRDAEIGFYLDPVLRGRYPEALMARLERDREAPLIVPGDLEAACAPIDFLGVNFYFTRVEGLAPEGRPTSELLGTVPRGDLGWPDNPAGLRSVLTDLHRKYGLPIYVTENGLALFEDDEPADRRLHDERRLAYLKGHVDAVALAIADGADVRGYFVWSLMDNFEWQEGYRARFGLVHVDYESQRRSWKDSARWYAQLASAARSRSAVKPGDAV